MCKNQDKIVFCTCTKDQKQNIINVPTWELYRFKGFWNNPLEGMITPPENDLGMEGINVESILSTLNHNKKSSFDFIYKPKDQDKLVIRLKTKAKGKGVKQINDVGYFSLIFENGEWREGMLPLFISRVERLSWGKVRVLNSKGWESIKSRFILDYTNPCSFESIEAADIIEEARRLKIGIYRKPSRLIEWRSFFIRSRSKLKRWLRKN